jgi:hypothetical protein
MLHISFKPFKLVKAGDVRVRPSKLQVEEDTAAQCHEISSDFGKKLRGSVRRA